MAIENAISAAVSGLRSNAQRVQVAADNIANVSTPGFVPREVVSTSVVTGQGTGGESSGGGVRSYSRPASHVPPSLLDIPTVDLGVEFSRLIEARTAYGAAADLIRTGSEMIRQTLYDDA